MQKGEKGFKTVAYIITILSVLILAAPLFLMIVYSMMDASAIYDLPPRILPVIPTSISIVLDYEDVGDEDLETILVEDSIAAIFITNMELRGESIGEIQVYGVREGVTVFHQRAHTMKLKLITSYQAYRNLSLYNDTTIFYDNRHLAAADELGYSYNIDGLSESFDAIALGEDPLNETVINHITDAEKNRSLHAMSANTVIEKKPMLMLENYRYYVMIPSYMFSEFPIIQNFSFFAFIFNTLIVIIWAVITQVGLCSLTAFGISRLVGRTAGKIIMFFFLITMMIPFMSIIMPQLIMMQRIGAIDNYAAMLLPYLYPSAFYIFLFKGFFDRLPQSLFDAAEIDGASKWYAFTRLAIPLSKPIIAVVTINAIVAAWGDFTWYLVAANRPELWTINLALHSISTTMQSDHNVLFGLSIVTILPILALTLIFSRQIKESIMGAGIKG